MRFFSNISTQVLLLFSFALFAFLASFLSTELSKSALAADTRTFKVSAYYSPLLGQDRYVSGSYAADIRMNGNGTHGADGTAVYVGMISAPYTYSYGTKISLPGLGVGTVHDRGGAIYAAQGYDRLDIWMGYGDEGRVRALQWGIRMVEGSIVASNTVEGFTFGGMTPESARASSTPVYTSVSNDQFSVSLWKNISNRRSEVIKLQDFLREHGYFTHESSGTFGPLTEKAVIDFQLAENIIDSQYSYGAGTWGPKTRKRANIIFENPEESVKKIEENTTVVSSVSLKSSDNEVTTESTESEISYSGEAYFAVSLWRGKEYMNRTEVRKIQSFLKTRNVYKGSVSGKYSQVTRSAVFDFQVKNNLVTAWTDAGAGEWGPKTRSIANVLYNNR